MYKHTDYRVRIGDKISPEFTATSGVKQGCPLSPILSNIFQNDIHTIFSDGCDPINIGDMTLNSISWADDLLLISESPEGLQMCLDKLRDYCIKWGLSVNTDKTKTMVLSKIKWTPQTFIYNGSKLECVKQIPYLGFQFSYNGQLKHIVTDRITKARKMANMIMRAIRTTKNV